MHRRDADDALGTLGCASCYGDDPDDTWAYYRQGLTIDVELVDDSHFIVQLRRCADCSQQFVWIFTEFLDPGGDDAQYRDVVPLTPDEAESLAQRGSDLDFELLAALGSDRRYLQTDWPTGKATQVVRWSIGRLLIMRGG